MPSVSQINDSVSWQFFKYTRCIKYYPKWSDEKRCLRSHPGLRNCMRSMGQEYMILDSCVTGAIPVGSTELLFIRSECAIRTAPPESEKDKAASRLYAGMTDVLADLRKVSRSDAQLYKYVDRRAAEKITPVHDI